jgi:hypothetical protein
MQLNTSPIMSHKSIKTDILNRFLKKELFMNRYQLKESMSKMYQLRENMLNILPKKEFRRELNTKLLKDRLSTNQFRKFKLSNNPSKLFNNQSKLFNNQFNKFPMFNQLKSNQSNQSNTSNNQLSHTFNSQYNNLYTSQLSSQLILNLFKLAMFNQLLMLNQLHMLNQAMLDLLVIYLPDQLQPSTDHQLKLFREIKTIINNEFIYENLLLKFIFYVIFYKSLIKYYIYFLHFF